MKFIQILLVLLIILTDCCAVLAQKTGKATYYANRFHGRRTSSGDIYHKDSFTCAHKTLPFGTMLKVKDTKTGNEVIVKVNDRLGRGTMIDLSYAAAKELGIIERGTTQVEITPYKKTEKIPYKMDDLPIPQLQVKDPSNNGYCLLSEWGARYNKLKLQHSMAKSYNAIKNFKTGFEKIKQDSVPHYKILNQLTAQSEVLSNTNNMNLLVE